MAALPARAPRALSARPRPLGRRRRQRGGRAPRSAQFPRSTRVRACGARTRARTPWRSGRVGAARGGVGARRGDWRRAADLWEELDSPYEAALALAQGEEEPLRQALEELQRLGAAPAAALV